MSRIAMMDIFRKIDPIFAWLPTGSGSKRRKITHFLIARADERGGFLCNRDRATALADFVSINK